MKKLTSSQWGDFQNAIASLPDRSLPQEILITILDWLRRNFEICSSEPFASYRLDRFLELNVKNCPTEAPPMEGTEFEHFKKIMKKYTAKDTENIAMYLRDTLESLVVLEVNKQCLKCERWGLGAYKNGRDGRIAFECRHCGIATYLDGTRVGPDELTFACNDDLREIDLGHQ